MELNIVNEVATLERLSVGQLRQRFVELFGETTKASNRTWLVKRIIWRMQALTEGDLSERARRRAAELARDIPMYFGRWRVDEAMGRNYLSLGQGVQDAWSRRVVTFAWEEWCTEMSWMTLYFSVCVWWSLVLVHVPRWWPCPKHETTQVLGQ